MQNCISTISIISTYRRAAALLDGSGKRVYFLREKGAFFFTGKTPEQPEQNRQQEAGQSARTTTPGNRPRISAPLQGRKGKARKRRPPVVYKCAVTTRRRNIPNNADDSRGTGRRISRTRKAKEPRKNPERKREQGSPCRSAAILEKMKPPLPDQPDRISDTGNPLPGEKCKGTSERKNVVAAR